MIKTEIAVLILAGVVDYSKRYNIPFTPEQTTDAVQIMGKLMQQPEVLTNPDLIEIGLNFLKENV